jgi:hypothetical protein
MIYASSFTVKGVYYNVKALMTVDCDRKTADLMMSIDNKIHNMGELKYHEVDTIEKAKQFLNHDTGEHGTFLEYYYEVYGRNFNHGIH